MASPVTMPQMGFDMREGRLVRWLKAPGDAVQKGEALAEIETDKATVELEAFESGRLAQILVEEGATVPVGEPVALLETAPEAAVAPTPARLAPPGPARPEVGPGEAPGAEQGPAPARAAEAGRRASPVARRLAQERGVDLEKVRGSGPGGRILGRDVAEESPAARAPSRADGRDGTQQDGGAGRDGTGRRARQAGPYRFQPPYHDPADYLDTPTRWPAGYTSGQSLGEQPFAGPPSTVSRTGVEPEGLRAAPSERAQAEQRPAARPERDAQEPVDVEPWSRMRQTIARRMSQAKREIPHFYETMRVEMDQALAFRVDVNDDLPDEDRLSVNDLLVRAAALALEEFPTLNGTYTEEGLRLNQTVDVAIAVAVEGGLLTPVVRDCNARGLVELAREVHRVVRAARKGRLKPEEYAGGTFTISNLGMFGVESFSAIINPPQTAILAAGGTRQEVVVADGQMRPATVLHLTVAADHRVTDGVEVARFLNRTRELLEHPWLLVSPHLRG
ncbi:dihydrolipoamide acetyltransferase family protein [Limnochorda pilosa]|uniref:Dihydrolipoamide acetyltransferase component of pyruvate dehydrogenase complex n=1 Tax=Limnochorda pilosa TaxID=1555112 RepID=A0A0K2SG89_LIMPI|nr:dihydrolipoamide acetyltransferase family protein [Limnochorda pilosa]BAS26057.1 branched-chain alpha-keto acid dehydrogenase subunit E2 [Limnochorda pilosa]